MASVVSRPRGEEPTKSASRTTATSSGPSFETSPAGAPQDEGQRVPHRAARDDFRWHDVEMRPYKEDERALYKAITRQILFSDPEMAGELRYFEVAPGGFSTLERHEHMHGVLILRGSGHCLVGDEVKSLETRDLVTVPPLAWHQFRASKGEPLGFLCMVNAERDRPQLPTAEDVARLRRNPAIAAFFDDKS
jgi:mannose-6-phosphate isomerase-like protein (cupin superfamily)